MLVGHGITIPVNYKLCVLRGLQSDSLVFGINHYSSASGGLGLLVPSDRAVICSAKPLRGYLLVDFIKRYINKLILLLLYIVFDKNNH